MAKVAEKMNPAEMAPDVDGWTGNKTREYGPEEVDPEGQGFQGITAGMLRPAPTTWQPPPSRPLPRRTRLRRWLFGVLVVEAGGQEVKRVDTSTEARAESARLYAVGDGIVVTVRAEPGLLDRFVGD